MPKLQTEQGFLIYDWRTRNMRIVKTRPTRPAISELIIDVKFTVRLPDPDIPKLALSLDVPAAAIEAVIGEQVKATLTRSPAPVVDMSGRPVEICRCETQGRSECPYHGAGDKQGGSSLTPAIPTRASPSVPV